MTGAEFIKTGSALTSERILANVELALELGIRVSLRVNTGAENIHGMKDLIDDLKVRGFIDRTRNYYDE